MPAIRNGPAFNHGTDIYLESKSKRSTKPPQTPIRRASDDSKAQKRKKTSNAFFLYRSHVIANNLLPTDVKHQNDASRIAAQMWKGESQKTRTHFFSLAEEIRRKQREIEENELEILEPPVPGLSPSTSSTRSSFDSPPLTPMSPCFQTPPAPKMRSCELPSLPLISSPQTWELMPVLRPEVIPEPNHNEALLSPLSEEWFSLFPTSSLVFSHDYKYSSIGSNQGHTYSYASVPQPALLSAENPTYSPLHENQLGLLFA